ncbi:IS6 family transposase, partial [Paraburkholderia dipogonis]
MLRSSGAAFLRGAAATLLILLCVQWYVAYSLSLRNLEEMMAERGIGVDHSTVHRWAIKLLPVLE